MKAMRVIHKLRFFFLLSALLVAPVEGRQVAQGAPVYDIYEAGIHTGELVLSEGRWDKALTLKRKDRLTGRWSSPMSVFLDSLSTSQEFPLPGALRILPSIISQVESEDWDSNTQVTIATKQGAVRQYVKHRKLTELAGGKMTSAFYWALKDGGLLKDRVSPLDLVIGAGDELIAGVDPSADNSIVLRGYEMFTSQKLWSDSKISPAKYGYRKLKEMVRMSDGVRLATHVYLPDGGQDEGRYPAILIRSPYTPPFIPAEMIEKMPLPDHLWNFVARGYALVHQDVRGTGHSEGDSLAEGKWLPWVHELKDGDETLTWVAGQPWCDGNVGMSGASYMGMTQWAAAHRGNPALKAMIPVSTLGTPFNDMPFTGGAITAPGEWVFMMSGAPMDGKYDWGKIWKHRPQIDMDLVGMGRKSGLWNLFMTRTIYDDFWKAADWLRHEKNITQPALQISGWYDEDLPGTLANWEMMQRNRRASRRLILGPWPHVVNRDRMINGVPFGADAIRNDLKIITQKWYDKFLKGIDNGAGGGPAVEYFSVGDNVWKEASQWPPKGFTLQPWYFHSPVNAGVPGKQGRLSRTPPGSEPPDTYRYDPQDPTPGFNAGGEFGDFSLPADYRHIEMRPDVVVYTSAPLEEDLEMAGNISAVLYASTSAKDTDWVIRLTDVGLNGDSVLLTIGVIRARHRESSEYEKLLTPGKVERYDISMRAHANLFKKGHRIRVSVTSAAAGYILQNSNTGENEATVTRTVTADQKVFHDKRHASFISLPIIRRGRR